ncbi:DeoR/GlpR family DNA-binding transcription regulator [Acidisoma sp. 7E03]
MPQKASKSRRHSEIVAALAAQPSLRVADLAATLAVSTETIRRDLDELGAQGLINRTYGGAVRPFGPEPAIRERHRLMVAERERIAVAASAVVNHGDALLIGSGATTTHVARRLGATKRDLTVLTHAFGVATVLAANPTLRVLMTPGRYLGEEGALVGAETVAYLATHYARHALLGASGLTAEGPTEADAEAAAVYRAMAGRAAEVTIVADHSKFGRAAFGLYAPWRGITRLVTDRSPDGALAQALSRAGVAVILAP